MDQLAKLTAATAALAEARTLDEVKQIHDIAQAAQVYARAAKLGLEAQNHAAEIKLLAERKAGALLAELERGQNDWHGNQHVPSSNVGQRQSEYSAALQAADVTRQTAHRWQVVASVPEQELHTYIDGAKERGQEITTTGALMLAKTLKRQQQQAKCSPDAPLVSDAYRLFCGDFRQVCGELADESIDVIITDPPYPREFLPLFGALGAIAKRVLRPGGSLVVMVGQSYLPEVLGLLTPHLDYHWMAAYLTPGGQSVQLWQRKVNTFWKPLLWFIKGEYTGAWIGDVTRSSINDKRFHQWGQSESGMIDIVQRFSQAEQTILDPFCGAGTTGIAALLTGRRFIGIDNDTQHIDTTRQRLHAATIA